MTPAEQLSARLRKRSRPVGGRKVVWCCKLLEKRRALDLSLRDIEAATGINNATLSQTERGADPTLLTAWKIAAFFGCTVEEIWSEPIRPEARSKTP